jgi:head-tail adaptor
VRAQKVGRYRQRLMVQAPPATETFDSFQQPVVVWSTIGVYWGEVSSLGGKELESARQVKSQATLQIKMRYLGAGVLFSSENRIVLGDRFVATASVANGSNVVTLSAPTYIPRLSSVIFPFVASTGIGDSSLSVYQITAGSGTSYTINPPFGGATQAGITVSQARFFGLVDAANTEERNRQFVARAYEIQQGGPI